MLDNLPGCGRVAVAGRFARDLEAIALLALVVTIGSFWWLRRPHPEHSPAVHVRRPRLDYESHVTGLDRNELGALLVAAGLSSARDHALISLLAFNGLRISEAL